MCTFITFCWTRQLSSTTLIGPFALGERDLCVLVLHSAGPGRYLTLLSLVPLLLEDDSYLYLYYILLDQRVIQHYFDRSLGNWRTRFMCTCITFCWTRYVFNTTLIGPLAFKVRELCVLVLNSAETDTYLILLSLVSQHWEDGSYEYLYYILLDQTVK